MSADADSRAFTTRTDAHAGESLNVGTTCRKARYRDHLSAKIALASTQRTRAARRNETRAYRCGTCHGWHLTSQTRNKATT